MKKYPSVAIVGRANVGKSSLFNLVAGKPQAVTAKEAGTTRDSVHALISHDKKSFQLIDTAGLKNPEDDFEETIQDQIDDAILAADLILVVVDGSTIVTEEDAQAAKKALKSEKPVILAINKIDQAHDKPLGEFYGLGIKDVVKTSVTQRLGIADLKSEIARKVPKTKLPLPKTDISVSIIGRPNMGKSHLFNALGEKQQAIVASRAGTTRDLNHMELTYHGKKIGFYDTAGMRKQRKIAPGAEKFSVLRTIHAIENSDISIILLDPFELVTSLDKKIAGIVKDAGKGLIIDVNKWDIADKNEETQAKIGDLIGRELQFVWWAPLIFTSAVTGRNVAKLFDLILDVYDQFTIELPEQELKRAVNELFSQHKPASKEKKRPKLLNVTQSSRKPPEITLAGPHLKQVHWSYRRYIENGIRERFSMYGTPIRLRFLNKETA